MKKWGKIAIGVRATHPDADFFRCWTYLLIQGLRSGDSVINPAIEMPHHVAANWILKSFLQSGCDSLLMIDDDMVFNPNILEKMRSNEASSDYDIVQALCLSRGRGHKPVMLTKDGDMFAQPTCWVKEQTGIVKTDVAGMAMTLIRGEVIRKLSDKYKTPFEWSELLSEDSMFCSRASNLGYKIGVDCDNPIGHRIKQVLVPQDHGIGYLDTWTMK